MNNLYDALENCLQALEHGQDLDSVLKPYPDLAKQLRPMLEASLRARASSGRGIPNNVQGRGRARLLQRAAEMREAKRAPRRRMIPMFSRWAITLGVAGVLFISSTGLVNASSGTLPGDQLYPVKRTWEDVRLLFVFNPQGRNVLQSQYEQERLNEIDDLLTKGRSASITFSGLVTNQQNGRWLVSGIPVLVTTSTRLPAGPLSNGVPITVIGTTRNDGAVDAQEIQLLQPGVSLPPLEPSGDNDLKGELDNENHNAQAIPTASNDNSRLPPAIVTAPATPAPETQLPPTSPSPSPDKKGYEFSGVIESMQGNKWNINGQSVIVDQAQIDGAVMVGSTIKFEGYYDANGNFIVTKIEVKSGDGALIPGKSGGGSFRNPGNGSDSGSPSKQPSTSVPATEEPPHDRPTPLPTKAED